MTPAASADYPRNRRRSRSRGLLFYRLIEGAVATDPHPYKTLLTPQMTLEGRPMSRRSEDWRTR